MGDKYEWEWAVELTPLFVEPPRRSIEECVDEADARERLARMSPLAAARLVRRRVTYSAWREV